MVAKCKILRDLEIGEQVVVDVQGIRSIRKTESREQRNAQEFSFMSSGVSSERRVELVVEQVAWELRKIRDAGGKVVVTAGPVVIHTGGGEHLARLIRLEGHLLDTGLINRALDLIVDMGGSFQVLNFNLGEQRQSTSAAEVKVSAPSHDVMEGIFSNLIDLGAVDLPQN